MKLKYNIMFWLYLAIALLFILYYGNMHNKAKDKPQTEITPQAVQVVQEEQKPPETQNLSSKEYSAKDKIEIALMVNNEAKGESDEGQRAIVQVVLNRIKDGSMGNGLTGVLHRQGQFTFSKTYTEKELVNVSYTLENGFDMPDDIMYFGTWNFRGKDKVWRKIGGHYFMR